MNNTARLLILENRLGQKVRTFAVDSKNMNIVFLKDSRRVEAISDLKSLDDNDIEYTLLKKIDITTMSERGLTLTDLGHIRLATAEHTEAPSHALADETDDQELKVILQKTAVGHVIAIVLLLIGSWIAANYFSEKAEEPQLVTIVMPKKEVAPEKPQPVPHVKMAEHKIKPTNKTVHKKMATHKLLTKAYKVKTVKATDIQRVGALAALGGVAKGAHGAEGLDLNSMKNIRAAGTGNGGGGVGSAGKGGVKGWMPGSGLIAGSAGEGGRAQSAGGYGTKGTGGGKAGYGKISLVGGTSAVSLPLDEEPTVEGGLDRDQIMAVINRNKGQIIYCYEKGLQASPSIGGRVAVDFTIGPAGRITMAKVAQTSLGSKYVENCMIAKMRTWQFPKPVGKVNVDVLYPFELARVSSR
jgi:TonB family protein